MYKDKKKVTTEGDLLKESHPFALIGFGELLLVCFLNLIKSDFKIKLNDFFLILKIVSLALDGFTGAIQDRMNTHHTTKTHSMMFNINIWSCLWVFIGNLIAKYCFKSLINIK
jgi:hypothetical protein